MKRPPLADERSTIAAFLGWHRETLRLKCIGLNPSQLATRAVGRSALSLLGLVRHAAESERFWFRQVLAGEDLAPLFSSPANPDAAFEVAADPRMVTQAWRAWQVEIAYADRFIAAAPHLDITGIEPGEGPVSLRWVLMHMLEEYARHNGDLCWWLAADFDGQAAMLDALAYIKAARAWSVPAALEASRSGVGAHVWVFFAAPVPAETARRLGTGLLREAMALRGHMDLASYDRLFPSQDVLPSGGVGNLIAAPL